MRRFFSLCLLALSTGPLFAQEWRATTVELIEKEKPGYGKLCGVAVDHTSGAVFVNLSDKGLYRSDDQGKSWHKLGALKGRTEWPGCLMLDPVKTSKRIVTALVYGAPISVSTDGGETFKPLSPKSSHVDWCAVDWNGDMKFILTLKHESGDLLIASRDGGKTFEDIGKGYGPAWIFDDKTAVVAQAKSKTNPKPAILRTTDGAKTFEPVATYAAKALPRWRDGILYWVVEGALIATKDEGKTWQKLADLKDGRFGPIFGKSERQMFVLTGAGIVESTDGGKSWTKPIAVPRELKGVSPLTWMEYDPVHDVLYAMKMTSELYKLERR
ncbi:MAG: hypothetical protein U0793_34305 [Gemmataceae bacterium]